MMTIRVLTIAAAALGWATSASAVVLLDANFDSENGGASALNYTGFADFTVDGAVDLVASGNFGISCAGGAGACVDLAGSPGPGTLNSLFYAFEAGDEIILTALVSGNQRGGADDALQFGFEFVPNIDITDVRSVNTNGTVNEPGVVFTNVAGIFTANIPVPSNLPFALVEYRFTALDPGQVRAVFQLDGADSVGPILDNVRIELVPGDVPAPAALALFGLGVLALGVARRR